MFRRCSMMLLLMALLIHSGQALAQSRSATSGLSVKAVPGVMSYYGDMSTTNYNPLNILSTSSRFGGSLGLVKQFSPWFGVQAQFAGGWLYSYRNVSTDLINPTEMEGELTEFGLSLRIDPLKIFMSPNTRISPFLSAGVATISYRSARRHTTTNNVILGTQFTGYENDGVTPKNPKPTAMAIPLYLGVSYQLLPYLSIEAEYGLRLTNTDLLDALVGNTNVNDYYSTLGLGLRYHFGTKSSAVAREPKTATPRTTRTRAEQEKEQSSRSTKPLTRRESRRTEEPDVSPIKKVNVFVESQIPQTIGSGRIYDVTLRINKGDYKGPGKIIQKYPEGFMAMESVRGHASFSFSNQTVIIDWDQMPAEPEISYTYQIRVGQEVAGSHTVSGRFEYQQPEGVAVNRFNNYTFAGSNLEDQMDRRFKELMGETDTTSDKTTGGKEELSYQDQVDKLLSQYSGTTAGQTSTEIITESQPLSGVVFRIQVGAFKDRSQGGSRLSSRYGITEALTEEFENGWYKYTVGSFRNYQDAARFRDAFIQRTQLWSSFIVAYQDGKRLARISDALR